MPKEILYDGLAKVSFRFILIVASNNFINFAVYTFELTWVGSSECSINLSIQLIEWIIEEQKTKEKQSLKGKKQRQQD